MLTAFILLSYAFVSAWISGNLFIVAISRIMQSNVQLHPAVVLMTGIFFMGVSLQCYHVFFAVDARAHAYIWGINLVLLLYTKKTISRPKLSRREILFLSIATGAAILNIIGRAGVGDIADYHLQAIQWIAEHEPINGLSNLRRQLANNSTWFILHAFWGMSFAGFTSVYVGNALLLILAVWYFTPTSDDSFFVFKSVLLLYVALMAFRKYVGAVTNDYVITVFTLLLLSEWIMSNRKTLAWHSIITFCLLAIPTFKLSAIVLALVPLGYLVFRFMFYQRYVAYFIIMLILICIPWCITTYIHSGYLVYPIKQTALFSPDWLMPDSVITFERQLNLANERMPGFAVNEAIIKPITVWFPYWIKHLDAFSKILLILFPAALIFVSVKLHKLYTYQLIALTTVMGGMILWFTQAPAIRFVFGYILFTCALAAQLYAHKIPKFISANLFRLYPFIVCALGILFTFQYIKNYPIKHILWMPKSYAHLHDVKKANDPAKMSTAKPDMQCWDLEIPCSTELPDGLQLRGESIKDGFRIEVNGKVQNLTE
jgi:hypothetical protein